METTTKGKALAIGQGLTVYKVKVSECANAAERKAINQENAKTLRKAATIETLRDRALAVGLEMGESWAALVQQAIDREDRKAAKAAEKATTAAATAEPKTDDVANVAALVNAAKAKNKTAEPSEAAAVFGSWKTPTAKRCETLAAKIAAMIENGDRDGLQVLAVDLGDGAVIAENAGYGQTAATLAAFAQHCRDEAMTM